jgi:hypothetical protein
LHAETAANIRTAAARTPRLRNTLKSVETAIWVLLAIFRPTQRRLFTDATETNAFGGQAMIVTTASHPQES